MGRVSVPGKRRKSKSSHLTTASPKRQTLPNIYIYIYIYIYIDLSNLRSLPSTAESPVDLMTSRGQKARVQDPHLSPILAVWGL